VTLITTLLDSAGCHVSLTRIKNQDGGGPPMEAVTYGVNRDLWKAPATPWEISDLLSEANAAMRRGDRLDGINGGSGARRFRGSSLAWVVTGGPCCASDRGRGGPITTTPWPGAVVGALPVLEYHALTRTSRGTQSLARRN